MRSNYISYVNVTRKNNTAYIGEGMLNGTFFTTNTGENLDTCKNEILKLLREYEIREVEIKSFETTSGLIKGKRRISTKDLQHLVANLVEETENINFL